MAGISTRVLAGSAVLFEPADPPRVGRIVVWEPAGGAPPEMAGEPGEVEVVVAEGEELCRRTVSALRIPVGRALAALVEIDQAPTFPPTAAAAFWARATTTALRLVAGGRLLPGVSARGYDAWRVGPLERAEAQYLNRLAAALPAQARAIPLPGWDPPHLPAARPLLGAFLDAVADTVARDRAASAPFAGPRPRRVEHLRQWASDLAAATDARVELSLRVEVDQAPDSLRAVVQVHSPTEPALVAEARDVLTGAAPGFGEHARAATMLELRRAAEVWAPLRHLLGQAVADQLPLGDEEVADLLAGSAARLAEAGIGVHWPRELASGLSATAHITTGRTPPSHTPSLLEGELDLNWRLALGGHELSEAERQRLAQAHRPIVQLRDQWVLLSPELARAAREPQLKPLGAVEALGAALSGATTVEGQLVEVTASGWLEELRQRLSDPATRSLPQPAGLLAELRDYQKRALAWLALMTSCGLGVCLADDMGLGKTITLIALHLHRQTDPATAGPTLVVCPTSLLGNWEREIGRFAPAEPVRRFHGAARELREPAGFVLTTYATMRGDAERLATCPWALVVADEAQHVKNPRSQAARALRVIGAKARVALTGTPVENNLSELWAILDWASPGLLGTLASFRRRWADAAEGGDPEATRRLSRLVGPFVLRRRKSDPGIAPELPAKTETDRLAALSGEQVGLYEAVVAHSLEQIAASDGMERRGLVMKLLTSLKQICNHPAHYLKEASPPLAGRSGKLDLLDELLETIIAEDGAVLVFTQYVAMARLIQHHLAARDLPTQLLHGATSLAQREEMVRRFQDSAPGKAPVFLLSLKAAGTGLNLTRADHVVHYDRWWNPAVERQASDRAHRIGQSRPVQVHRLITEGTVEDRIAAMLRAKQELADAVLAGGEVALSELSDAELAELVELRNR